jgi:hypothetical protein
VHLLNAQGAMGERSQQRSCEDYTRSLELLKGTGNNHIESKQKSVAEYFIELLSLVLYLKAN